MNVSAHNLVALALIITVCVCLVIMVRNNRRYVRTRGGHTPEMMYYTTHKSLEFMESDNILRVSMKGWLEQYGDQWSFTGDDTAADLFNDNSELAEFVETYNSLPHNVMKADMWRLAKVYINGGWWVDGDTMPIEGSPVPTPPDLELMYVTRENNVHMSNMMFYAPRHCHVLRLGLQMIKDRVARMKPDADADEYKEQFGESYIHFLTGPGLFTSMLSHAAKTKHPHTELPDSTLEWTDVPEVFSIYIPEEDVDIELKEKALEYYRDNGAQPSHGILILFGSVAHMFAGQNEGGWHHELMEQP